MTQQINATTLAVFSLPKQFTNSKYGLALSPDQRHKMRGTQQQMTYKDIILTEEKHVQVEKAFKHAIQSILLAHMPGKMQKQRKTKHLCTHTSKTKPKIRVLEHEKTRFYPLPALNKEEASVSGTIWAVQAIYTKILAMSEAEVTMKLRLLVGDWLSIRNLRLMKDERAEECSDYLHGNFVQEASMPFHFQLNAMYALCCTHSGTIKDDNPSSLEHHRTLLWCSKLDPKKPEYNKVKELVTHSLITQILDCTR
jgi:hypothetical protein